MDKMREEFEAWFCSTIPYPIAKESWFAIMDGGDYIITDVQAAWAGWKASREALCVELPEREVAGKYADDFEDGHESGFNDALSDCRVALKKAGVSYK